MTTVNRATWVDDDGSGMTGTIINNARLQGDIYDRVDGALATLDAKDTTQDTAIAANGPHGILSAQHPDTTPAALVAGDMLVVGAGGKLVRLPKSTDGHLLTLASGVPAWAPAGVWSDVPYNAGNFSADSGTWTVEAADVQQQRYLVVGKMAIVAFGIASTGITGVAATALRIYFPTFPLTLAGSMYVPCTSYTGAWNTGSVGYSGGNPFLQLVVYATPARGSWPVYSNTQMFGQIVIPLA